MVSSNVQEAKEIAARLHQITKKFFDDFYAKAAKAGRFPGPHEAMVAFGRVLKRAAEKEWPPPPPGRPSVPDEVWDLVHSRFFSHAYHDAVDAQLRHTPGIEIEEGKPGRKPNVKLAERIWALDEAGKTNREIHETLKSKGLSISLEAVEAYLKTRRRPRKQ